jgi:hypothetical protein
VKGYPWTAGVVGLSLAGCAHFHLHHHHQTSSPTPDAATQTAQPTTLPTTEPISAEPASPEILQQKTQSYTQSLQQLLSATQETHSATSEPSPVPTAPPVATPAPQPAAPPPPLEAVAAPPAPAVDVSINPPAPAPTKQSATPSTGGISSLTQRIDQQAHDQPHDAAVQLDQQLLTFVRNEPVPDENALAGLPAEDRDVLSAILDGLSNYRDILRSDPTATNTRKLQPLLDMADRLHSAADLNVPAIALCLEVRGFGDYDAINVDSVPAAQSLRALVYCQVANFSSQLSGQMWEVHLNERLTLYSEATGKSVWKLADKKIADRCRQRRHDCYCVELIELPPDLPPGKYILTATLEDQISNKLTQANVAITVK